MRENAMNKGVRTSVEVLYQRCLGSRVHIRTKADHDSSSARDVFERSKQKLSSIGKLLERCSEEASFCMIEYRGMVSCILACICYISFCMFCSRVLHNCR